MEVPTTAFVKRSNSTLIVRMYEQGSILDAFGFQDVDEYLDSDCFEPAYISAGYLPSMGQLESCLFTPYNDTNAPRSRCVNEETQVLNGTTYVKFTVEVGFVEAAKPPL
jgi:hypothetical protein